jgi:hypothetical protein
MPQQSPLLPESFRALTRSGLAGYAIGPAFLLLAGYFALGPRMLDIPQTEAANVSREQVRSDPLRSLPRHPPAILRGGYELNCMECHRLFASPAETPLSGLLAHQDVVLDHGMNDRCLNCHDRFNRDKLVLPGGRLIQFDESPRLCATCHGTVYRDWERGMHGRTSGSWDESHPGHRRLGCTECHDPHAPAFGQMHLLPGPNTIRMTLPKDHDDEHHEPRKRNPLRQWKHLLEHLDNSAEEAP